MGTDIHGVIEGYTFEKWETMLDIAPLVHLDRTYDIWAHLFGVRAEDGQESQAVAYQRGLPADCSAEVQALHFEETEPPREFHDLTYLTYRQLHSAFTRVSITGTGWQIIEGVMALLHMRLKACYEHDRQRNEDLIEWGHGHGLTIPKPPGEDGSFARLIVYFDN